MLKSYLLLGLVSVTQSYTLRFWTGQCNQSFEQCGNVGYGFCCQVGGPFCRTFDCADCQDGNDLVAFKRSRCSDSGTSSSQCREPGCCVRTGGTAQCAGQVFQGRAPNRNFLRAMMANNATATNDPGQIPPKVNCTKSGYPNMMHFEDAEGVVHEIHIPRDRYFEAHVYLEREDWDALKKFDKWSGQKYQPHEIVVLEDEPEETVANATNNPSDEAIEKPKPDQV